MSAPCRRQKQVAREALLLPPASPNQQKRVRACLSVSLIVAFMVLRKLCHGQAMAPRTVCRGVHPEILELYQHKRELVFEDDVVALCRSVLVIFVLMGRNFRQGSFRKGVARYNGDEDRAAAEGAAESLLPCLSSFQALLIPEDTQAPRRAVLLHFAGGEPPVERFDLRRPIAHSQVI